MSQKIENGSHETYKKNAEHEAKGLPVEPPGVKAKIDCRYDTDGLTAI